jgi:arsenite/tail-anchored protein-transporting ATPase
MNPDIYFFAGKGGTGKSTCSAIFSSQQSNKGKKVLINSIDPAHNLSQIFEQKLSDKSQKINDNLYAQETDINIWKKKYLSSIEYEMRSTYKNQTAFNLNKYFKTLKYSPGLGEYATILAIENTLKNNNNMDIIVFDTPPTALFLNFLSLPYSSLKWLEQLSVLRKLILQKREIIKRIHTGKKKGTREEDKVIKGITCMISEFKNLAEIFKSKRSHYIIVMNPNSLSSSESKSIMAHLKDLDISIDSVILNKYEGQGDILRKITSSLCETQVYTLIKEKEEIIGLEKLKEIPELFSQF